MIRGKWLLALCILILAAACTEKSTPTGPVADTPENRQAAAKRYLEAVPPQELLQNITGSMLMRMPEATKKKFQEALDDKNLLKKTYDICEKGLIKNFTPDEMNAMTAFFGSPPGKSARNKFNPYMRDIMPEINKEVRTIFTKVQEQAKKEQPPAGAPAPAQPQAAPPKPGQGQPEKPKVEPPKPPAAKPAKPEVKQPQTEQPKAEKPKPEQPKNK